MASLVCAQLLFLESENPDKDIYLYINSPGGEVDAGMSIYDTMQFIKPDVVNGVYWIGCEYGVDVINCWRKGKKIFIKAFHRYDSPGFRWL